MLEFIEETHEYLWDGVKVPCVSDILAPLKPDFSNTNPAVLENARQYGNAVHKAIELKLKGTLDYDSLDPILQNVLAEFDRIFTGAKIKAIESRYYSGKYSFAGTVDLLCDDCLVDYKTRSYNARVDDLQLTAYSLLTGERNIFICEFLPGKPGKLIKIKNSTKTRDMFLYLLDYYKRAQEFNKIIKNWR